MAEKRKKEKNLKPSLRENKRYLLLEGNASKEDKEKVEKAILDYIGILGYAKTSPMWIRNNVLAVNMEELNEVKAALLLAGIKVKRVSGTLRGLNKV